MTKVRFTLKALTLAVFMLAFSALANAQATRTWVSGVGDDVNPCSRTAPCKTFAGAISKTFINGEIDALDPGGYGTLTITKSISVDGGTGQGWASVLASGAPAGFTINLTDNSGNDPQKTVRLRNISINGTGASGTIGTRTGTNGIRIILATGSVFVENCLISDFTNRGISDERTTGGKLFVSDTTVRDTTQAGIAVAPTSGGTAISAILDHVRVQNCGFGAVISSGAKATITNSNFSGNTNAGIFGEGINGASELNIDECSSASNGTGIQNGGGAFGSTIRVSNSNITQNATAVNGSVLSYGNNRVAGGAGALTAIGATSTDKGQQ
jgi:hypothetical protein